LVLTSGRLPSFEAIAAALVAHSGARHVVVAGTDHNVQDPGERVNQLLEHTGRLPRDATGRTQKGLSSAAVLLLRLSR
jgi:hypothetical protein